MKRFNYYPGPDTGSGGGSEDHSEESDPDSSTVDITDAPEGDDSAGDTTETEDE